MAHMLLDAAADQAVLVPLTLVTTDVTFPAIRCNPRTWPNGTFWIVHVQSAAASGQITFHLDVAVLASGPFLEIGSIVWPPGDTTARQCQLGVTGTMATRDSSLVQWARVRVETTPPQPGVTFGSWLTTVGGRPGLGMRPGDAVLLP